MEKIGDIVNKTEQETQGTPEQPVLGDILEKLEPLDETFRLVGVQDAGSFDGFQPSSSGDECLTEQILDDRIKRLEGLVMTPIQTAFATQNSALAMEVRNQIKRAVQNCLISGQYGSVSAFNSIEQELKSALAVRGDDVQRRTTLMVQSKKGIKQLLVSQSYTIADVYSKDGHYLATRDMNDTMTTLVAVRIPRVFDHQHGSAIEDEFTQWGERLYLLLEVSIPLKEGNAGVFLEYIESKDDIITNRLHHLAALMIKILPDEALRGFFNRHNFSAGLSEYDNPRVTIHTKPHVSGSCTDTETKLVVTADQFKKAIEDRLSGIPGVKVNDMYSCGKSMVYHFVNNNDDVLARAFIRVDDSITVATVSHRDTSVELIHRYLREMLDRLLAENTGKLKDVANKSRAHAVDTLTKYYALTNPRWRKMLGLKPVITDKDDRRLLGLD